MERLSGRRLLGYWDDEDEDGIGHGEHVDDEDDVGLEDHLISSYVASFGTPAERVLSYHHVSGCVRKAEAKAG